MNFEDLHPALKVLLVVVPVLPVICITLRHALLERRMTRMSKQLQEDIQVLTAEERSRVLDAYIDAVIRRMRCLLPLVVLLALAGVCLAAPAPRPRPAPPPPAWVGTWAMLWKGGTHHVTFGPDGSYQCGETWAGTWCADYRHRILYVEELAESGSVLHWSVTLCGDRHGTLDDDTEWRLDPPFPCDR